MPENLEIRFVPKKRLEKQFARKFFNLELENFFFCCKSNLSLCNCITTTTYHSKLFNYLLVLYLANGISN